MFEHHGQDVLNMSIIIVQYFEGTDDAMFKSRFGILFLSILSFISLALIFYFGYKIWYKLSKQSSDMSEKTKKLQTQLVKALIVQAAIPTCVSFAPCIISWYQPIFALDFGRASDTPKNLTDILPVLDEVSTEYFREEVLTRYHRNIQEFPATAMVAYDPIDGSVRWWNIMGILNLVIVVNTQYAVMIYCGWSMHMQMEDKIKNFSEMLRRHHRQFFKTLIIQITTPTIVLFIPITFMITLPLFNLNVSIPSGVLLCSFTLHPAMESICVMYAVSEYKRTAIRICRTIEKVWKEVQRRKREPSTTSTAPDVVPADT
ncbi:hypothetical protein B9Z55_017622 [Caenorhabditis nigoni]|nr:hypothetical protein B9Z55_017622 [Caenorhabditis nigoni]